MKQFSAVFNSDAVNLYNMIFPVKTLESGLNQTWQHGTPSFITHDWHRPIAWSKSLGLYIEPSLIRLTGIFLVPENDDDFEIIYKAINNYLIKKTSEHINPYKQIFLDRVREHLTEKYSFIFTECAAITDNQIAVKLFPKLFQQKDKDGLIPLKSLNSKAPGVFEKDGILLFAHQYFRRSQSRLNSLNIPFFESINQISSKNNLDIRIALDEDIIGFPESFMDKFELEYWWGPKFTDNLSDIPLGVTKHTADENEKLFHGITGVDFWWYEQNDIRTFECEEIKNIPSFGIKESKYGCRFVHSMINENNIHLDGALRLYTEENMIIRIDNDISKAGKNTEYTKLWRIDGNIDISNWKELISNYFRDNHLIGEYFNGVDENILKKPFMLSNPKELPINEYIPANLSSGQGVRLSISYHNKSDELTNNRFFKPFDSFSNGKETLYYIEADSIELIKELRIRGYSFSLPGDIVYVAFEDMIINFPLINHTGIDSVKLANQTHEIINDLCKIWSRRGDDRIITYNIGIQYADKDVYYSIAGHVNDLVRLQSECSLSFPSNSDQIACWLENISNYLLQNYSSSNDVPNIDSIHKLSGLLLFERRFLLQNSYKLHFENRHVNAEIIIDEKEINLLEIIDSGKLNIALANIILDSECSKCNKSYFSCNCLKYRNDNVVQIIKDIRFIGAFWTIRKA